MGGGGDAAPDVGVQEAVSRQKEASKVKRLCLGCLPTGTGALGQDKLARLAKHPFLPSKTGLLKVRCCQMTHQE